MSSPIKRHFFVCTNSRPPEAKPSCGIKGSPNLYMKLMEEVEKRNLFGKIAVTATGCLGPCFDGPSIVVYPEGVWYANVTEADIPDIAENHMQNGQTIDRLVYKWPQI
ncbi:MAG TPA: (2Fe-2S) ferredoxin domain-containing protein [Spirochaetes bacterium]|nr:(2Fe-2S) ferredoxin domain-containing protein [Spirochaetota bacterium]